MKKLLIASTALVATAGMAAADITMSGYAEEAISSFFIFEFLVYLFIFRTSSGESSEMLSF